MIDHWLVIDLIRSKSYKLRFNHLEEAWLKKRIHDFGVSIHIQFSVEFDTSGLWREARSLGPCFKFHAFFGVVWPHGVLFLQEKCDVVQKLLRDGQKLVHAGHFDAATIKYKINKLDEMFKGFTFQLEQRRRILNQTHGFYRSSQPVRVWIFPSDFCALSFNGDAIHLWSILLWEHMSKFIPLPFTLWLNVDSLQIKNYR